MTTSPKKEGGGSVTLPELEKRLKEYRKLGFPYDLALTGEGGERDPRGNTGPSRALVKDGGGTLAINYDNDFKGGVRVDSGLRTRNDMHVGSSNVVVGDNQKKNRWIYHHPEDDRKQVWIAPWNGNDWAWGNALNFHQNGHLNVAKSLNVGAHGEQQHHGWTGANFRRRDGRWTHFDWVGDQNNYLRGNTVSDGIISLQDHHLRLRGMGDGNHTLGWVGSSDGPRLQGHGGGELATNQGGDRTVLKWDRHGTVNVPGKLCVGPPQNNWCLTPDANNHHLTIVRNNAADAPDQGFFRLTHDSNLWLNRSVQRGWVAENIKNKK